MSEANATAIDPKQTDGTPQPMTPAEIAWVCHEANRAYCETLGDESQVPWDEAPQWIRTSAVTGVLHALKLPDGTPEDQHNAWLEEKRAEGWVYGPVKDADKKTHPCVVPYHELGVAHKRKDYLFRAVVKALTSL
jgi:hypothetical protein